MNEGIHLDLDTWIVPGQIRMMMGYHMKKLMIWNYIYTVYRYTVYDDSRYR